MMERELSEEEQQELFAWIDKIPMSRPKRHISRDFSDGVMAAEVVKHFLPKLVELHNYIAANSTQQKLCNWNLLNRKVFSRLDFNVPEEIMKKISLSTSGAIVPVLSALREKIDRKLQHSPENALDLEYYETGTQDKNLTDPLATEAIILAQLKDMIKEERDKSIHKISKPEDALKFSSNTEPTFKQILLDHEHTVMALRETVEILQMKVGRLQHLVHLKDMRIEELMQHLEVYRTKGNLNETKTILVTEK